MLDIRDVFSSLFGLFLLIGVGYAAVQLQVLPASASTMLSRLLMNVTMPATIFTSLVQPYNPTFLHEGIVTAVLGGALFLLYGGISALAVRLFRVPQGRRGVWIFSCTFSNNGFMGFPIALALFGQEGLALALFLGIPFNLLAYTSGAWFISMDRTAAGDRPPVSWRSILLTAANAATLLGLLFYAAQIPIPAAVQAPLDYLSNVTTPLSMLIIGMNLTGRRFSELFRDRDAFSASFLRLLLLPLLTWGILSLLPLTPLMNGVILIIMAMPAPALASLLSETYEGNTQFAAEVIFLSSLLCLATIPLISLLL